MYVLHVPTDDAHTYIEELPVAMSTFLLLYVRMHCIYLVLVYLLVYVRTYCTYCCSYWCTYIPTALTAFKICYKYTPTAQSCCTPCTCILLYVQLINVSIYCCTYVLYLLPVPTDNVLTSGKKAEIYEIKTGRADKVIEALITPKQGWNRAKIIVQWEWLAFRYDGRCCQHACRL